VLLGLYAAKIEACRRSLPRREIGAAVRAIIVERSAALRAVAERRKSARLAWRERIAAARFGERLARQNARAPPRPELN